MRTDEAMTLEEYGQLDDDAVAAILGDEYAATGRGADPVEHEYGRLRDGD
jgi:hypothetical protein